MIKYIIASGFSTAMLLNLASPALSSEDVAINLNLDSNRNYHTTTNSLGATSLVQLAYQGSLKNQGIPSHGGLVRSVMSGKVNAEILVTAAIAEGRVSPNTLYDKGYLDLVDLRLQSFRNF
ncbi:hypothetical protein cce_1532 [Crocosphaera subtropica ATCC 51142]|uniref:Uncharacterized protein n=1 Tax=Crocosphaera subtropica (strain ATCC 51142 / BH68) TaxID=43989 RepID=B1WXD8_CROS5|nr:hypothetical protein [Crocosphaera subtropica]ACB50882.1 hypothetical protein cce_1532 [Crocosphaera subtropica ATCC 51142]